jgi:hypothetical protein
MVSPNELCGLDVVTPLWMRSCEFISLGFRAPANEVLMNHILSDDEFFMVIGGNEGIISTVGMLEYCKTLYEQKCDMGCGWRCSTI